MSATWLDIGIIFKIAVKIIDFIIISKHLSLIGINNLTSYLHWNTPMATANVIYSDFLIDFDTHPVLGDLIRVANDAAVKRAVRNIIFTNKGERFFNPTFGCGIQKLLFEPMTPQTTLAIRKNVEQSLYNFEPRIINLSVVVSPDFNSAVYNISIIFYIINISNPVSISLSLNRIR